MSESDQLDVKRSALNVQRSGAAEFIDRDNPWPGLASFTEDARGFFFGREKETDELSRLVRRQTLTVLFGQSGLGKSSLLHAGLFPLLRETDHLPLYLRLDHAPTTPALADQVRSALTVAFAAVKADAPAFRADETLWEYFHRKDVDIWSAKNRLLTPVLAFDQFEEIFTLGRADETCRERSRVFLAELACLVENRAPVAVQAKLDRGELDPARFNFTKPSCSVILSLREDFLPDLESLKQAMPALVHNRLRLKKLSGTQALEIVTKPAPHLLAEGVAEKIVEFVAGARGGSAERLAELDVEPPLLSVICRELNDRRRALGQEKITADLVSGNRREILTDFYERSVADLPAAMRNFIEDHLLTKSGFRDNFALETALGFPGVTQALIDTLVARRLLRVEDRLGLQRVELTHDVLAEVVRNARDARQQRIALEEAQERERLALAAIVRQARRQRFMIAGLALAVVGLCIGAFFGIRAQHRAAELAGQAELATGSRLLDEGQTGDGLAHLVAAARRDQGHSVAATRIVSSLAAHNFLLPVGATLKLPSPATYALILADGRSALLLCEDSRVRVLDLVEWKVAQEFSFAQKIQLQGLRVAAKNPAVFAVALVDGTVQVCDTATGRPRGKPITPPNLAKASQIPLAQLGTWRTIFGLSPDGRWLAANRGTTTVFDAATGEERFQGEHFNLSMASNRATWNPFSPDSSRIAMPFWDFPEFAEDTKYLSSASMLLSVPDGRALASRRFEIPSDVNGPNNFSADGTRVLMLGWGSGKAGSGTARTPYAVVCDATTLLPIGPEILFPVTNGWNEFLLTPDGNRVVFNLAGDRGARVYDVKTGQLAFPELPHGATFTGIGISDDSGIYATNSIDGEIRLWDLRTGALFAESTFKLDRRGSAALSPDGRTVFVFSPTGEAYRLEVSRGPAAPLVLPRPAGVSFGVSLAEKAPARVLYFTNTATTMFDVAAGRQIDGGFALPQRILGSARRPDDSTVRSGDVWIARTAAAGRTLWRWGEGGALRETTIADPMPSSPVPPLILSQNRHLAAIFGLDGTGGSATVKMSNIDFWDLRTGKKFIGITADDVIFLWRFETTDFSSDDQRFVVRENTEDGALRVYGIGDGKLLFQLSPEGSASFHAARFTHDGTRLLTGNAWGTLQIWDGVSGKPLQSIQAHSYGLDRIDFSPDGRYYATNSADGTAQVRDAATHEPVGAPLVHAATVNRVQFSADNTRVATSTTTGAVRVWDLRTGLPLHDPLKHAVGNNPNLDFSADGKFLLTHYATGDARATRLWAAPPTGPARQAPPWLLRLATICAGRRLDDSAKIVSALDEFDRLDELRREIAALPDDAPFAAWGKWFLSTDAARPIAPSFTVTPAEAQKLAETLAKVTPATPPPAAPTPATTPAPTPAPRP